MEEPILKIECNITVTTNYLSSGILSVSPSALRTYVTTLISFQLTVTHAVRHETLAQSRPRGDLHPDVEAHKITEVSHRSYGPIRLESGHQQAREDHGTAYLAMIQHHSC